MKNSYGSDLPNLNASCLRPTTSLSSRRYYRSAGVRPAHIDILPGAGFTAEHNKCLSPNWSAYIQPEGQPYFVRNCKTRIITEAYIYNSVVLCKISFWSKMIEDLISQKGITISDDVEIFLELDDDSDSCSYYFIDHRSRTEFWLDSFETDLLDIPPVISSSHLQLALEGHYWRHVEYFPMHFGGVSEEAVDELISILSHGRTDQLTSSVSTFPYTAAQCSEFLDILRGSQLDKIDGYTTCIVARIWSIVSLSRFQTHYGQEHPRLSRDQSILANDATARPHWMWRLSSIISFRESDDYSAKLESLFVDRLVYRDTWRKFMSQCLSEWKEYAILTFPLLICGTLLSIECTSSSSLAILSTLLCSSSILSAVILITKHAALTSSDAAELVNYIQGVQSASSHFQSVALAFSLPKLLFVWALVLFMLHCLVRAIGCRNATIAIAVAMLVFLFVKGKRTATSEGEKISTWRRGLSILGFRREIEGSEV